MEKVAIYLSYKNNKSLETNISKISNWCLKQGYDFTFYKDKVNKKSNSFKDREGLFMLKRDLKTFNYSKVIIKGLKEFSKNQKVFLNLLDFLGDPYLYRNIIESFSLKKKEDDYNE